MEHCRERARALIADVERHRGHRLPHRQQRHRLHQPHLLPPHRQPHPGFLAEQPREGAATHACDGSIFIEVALIGRIIEDLPAHAQQPVIGRHPRAIRRIGHRADLIDQHADDAALAPVLVIVAVEMDDLEDQRLQEIRNLDHAAHVAA